MDYETSTPLPEQGGFNERLDRILAEYEIGFVTHGKDVNKHLGSFKQAIRTLVLEEITGKDMDATNMGDTFKVNFARGYNTAKAEQRLKLGEL